MWRVLNGEFLLMLTAFKEHLPFILEVFFSRLGVKPVIYIDPIIK